ncbi:MAG: FHA domain-containing protein [Spirochaetaceae bacterium]|nr:FHA domain-containing protein [Spirochaetaceae bacterium]
MDETIMTESPIGKRLEKVKQKESRCLVFNGKKITLTAKIIIGRASSCDVVIDDMLVSREHAEIQQIKTAFYIKDLESRNGTFVNDKKVPKGKYLKLTKNDTIRLGSKIEITLN